MTTGISKDKLDSATRVWRYMSFTKFVSLLDSSALYFARLDFLGDPFEGALTQSERKKQEDLFYEMSLDSGIPASLYAEECRTMLPDYRKSTFVNCWHMNETESEAMWKLYSDFGKGIAIQSRVERLLRILPPEVLLRRVLYIDFSRESFADDLPFIYKRRTFEHEREIRAIIVTREAANKQGVLVKVDLHELIEALWIAPTAEGWLADLVRNVSRRYGLEVDVGWSTMTEQPIFPWTQNNWESA